MVPQHAQKLSSALWQLQQSGTFCDTILTVSGNVEIEAHAAVLAASSARLCSMLQQNRSVSTDRSRTCQYRLDVTDYDMSTVKALLEFIYTGEMIAAASLNCSSRNRNDLIGLCTKFGITMDDSSDDNSFAVGLHKLVIF